MQTILNDASKGNSLILNLHGIINSDSRPICSLIGMLHSGLSLHTLPLRNT